MIRLFYMKNHFKIKKFLSLVIMDLKDLAFINYDFLGAKVIGCGLKK